MNFSKTLTGILTCIVIGVSPCVSAAAEAPAPALPVIPGKTFSITDYGAVGDGKTLNTAAIQKAIDDVGRAGGGTLVVPAGRFLSGPIVLTSCMNLHLEKDAVILMTGDIDNWPVEPDGFYYQGFITSTGAHDIEISGDGTIDGQGDSWRKAVMAGRKMPVLPWLVKLSHCTRVEITGVTLRNSPMSHLVPSLCTDVTIRNVTLTAPAHSHNTDGIDPSGSNYLIEDCTMDLGDDNIAIKPGHGEVSRNYVITRCRFLHGHGMSIGSGTRHGGGVKYGLENVSVSHCSFNGTKIGIRIKAARGKGYLAKDISYTDITMVNVGNPFEIVSYYPAVTLPKTPAGEPVQPVTPMTPVFTGITISNATVTGSPKAGTIWGLPEMPVSNLTFDNVHVSAATGMTIVHARDIRFISSDITVQNGERLMLSDATVTGLPGH